VIATPGHMANHLSFAWRGALFSGDMVMGWSTSLVSPPDGDMTAFMASLDRLGGAPTGSTIPAMATR
jgi:glyoxylase-like metal-dependent hydrolase (beta-lactamase superfamily II)